MKIPKPLKVAGVLAGIGFGVLTTTNYTFYHNVSWDDGSVVHMRKMDGPISHSRLELHYRGKNPFLVIYTYDALGSDKRYSDNCEGTLDDVRITPPFSMDGDLFFDAKSHAQTHPDLLEQENRIYQQKLRKFQEKFPQHFKRFGLEKILQ